MKGEIFVEKMRKAGWSKFLACLLVLSMIAGFFGMVTPVKAYAVTGDEPALVITGTGVEHELVYTFNELKAMTSQIVQARFSTINTYNTKRMYAGEGVKVSYLLQQAGIKDDFDKITFAAPDGYSKELAKVDFEKTRYYYPGLKDNNTNDAEAVETIVAFRSAVHKNIDDGPVNFDELNDVSGAPPLLLMAGQSTIDDQNNPLFVGSICRIVVGNPLPTVFGVSGNTLSENKSYRMDELKLIQSTTETYNYSSSGGEQTDTCTGVSFATLLSKLEIENQEYQIEFDTTDKDTYPVDPITVGTALDPNEKYLLVYEGTNKDGNSVFGTKDQTSLRIYRNRTDGKVVIKNVTGIVINKSTDIDFTTSPYKHIAYTDQGNPYNIDDITTATLTIEGPGVENFKPISLPQIEEANDGLFRGTYMESVDGEAKQNTYEGITVSYLLDHFVTLTSDAQTVIFKDKSGNDIGEYMLDEVRKTDYLNNANGANNLQMIVAYGVNELPLVYTSTDDGYDTEKGNDNGPFKLVVGQATADEQAIEFSRVNKIYVTQSEGHYEHDQVPYNNPDLTNYLVTITGSGLGHEKNYSVADIEAMTDIQYEDRYSLSNSENYWYYNDYKGVKLWDLLLDAGLDPNIDENTTVQFIAADNYAFQPKTIKDIKDASQYGYYQKDPADLGDGSFDGTNIQPKKTGCPVLLAYGFNGYPYVSHPNDEGYIAGIGNDGGPLRVISGKKDYNDTNGSNQVQFAKKIIIGDNADYSIHSYAPYDTAAASPITVKVVDDNDTLLKQEDWTVKDIEDMVYNVAAEEADKARVKDSYFVKEYNGHKICDLYEGVGIWYLLSEQVGLPGTTGTVTFKDSSNNTETVALEDIRNANYNNESTGAENMKPVLVFAKNGYPMVVDRDAAGYAEHNDGGPLGVVFGQTTTAIPGLVMSNVQEITVKIQTDEWAHLTSPYNTYGTQTLTIHGDGARTSKTLAVNEVEALQNYIMTDEYYLAKSSTEGYSDTYRGIDLNKYLRQEVGLQATASGVTIVAGDTTSKTFTLEEIAKADYINKDNTATDLKVMLAYGKNNLPLVPGSESDGYSSDAHNKGGPLQLIIGQKDNIDFDNSGNCIKDVVEIIIEAEEGISWKHDHGLYTEYQDQAVLRVTGSEVKEPRTFTLKQLEALNDHIIRSTYTGEGLHDLEGVILWNLINDVVELKDGVDEPTSIRVFSGSNYNQIISDIDQVINGKENSQGVMKDIILSYATDGYPLVPVTDSSGYEDGNQFGPIRLVVEESKSMWVKNTDCIVVGTGDYEEPKAEDVIDDNPQADNDFFIDNVQLLDTSNQSITSVNNQAAYRIKASVTNNSTETQDALIIIQVRNGSNATATAGGNVLECLGVQMEVPTTGAEVTPEFTLPSGLNGKAYVDVFVWDDWSSQNPLADSNHQLSFDIN